MFARKKKKKKNLNVYLHGKVKEETHEFIIHLSHGFMEQPTHDFFKRGS
jgi:hypothetical protein